MLESQKSAAPEETALSRFALAQTVSIEVSGALQGKADSFRNLSVLQRSVSQSGAASMSDIRAALPIVLAAESDLQSLQRSGQRVAVLLPAFVDEQIEMRPSMRGLVSCYCQWTNPALT